MMNRAHTITAAVAAAAIIVLTSGVVPAKAQGQEVVRWNRIATDAMAGAQMDPLTESRVLAILHLAIHDALNSVERRYHSYTTTRTTTVRASADAAVAAAAQAALAALVPKCKGTFDEELRVSLETITDVKAREAGVAIGRRVATAVLARREHDGAARAIKYVPGTTAGAYRPTPPDFTPAFLPQWGSVTPFALKDPAQFRPAPPPAPSSALARRDIAIVQDIGSATSTTRTTEQSEIAKFWYEDSTDGWNRIARELAIARNLDSWASARLLALVNVAMADGFIGGFEAKYHYNYWRPATAIRETGDATWLSILTTPPVPDYPSTHTVLGAAAAAVLARFFETDYVSFQMTSGAPYAGITRRFWSFSEAAQENGASRVLAGIHFPTAVKAGYEQGTQIGAYAFDQMLAPVTTARTTTTVAR
jgi:membrane-associated phospholipid phosphatase